jgi:uncharacterized protein (TIGR04141 family)
MAKQNPYIFLNSFLVKEEFSELKFNEFITDVTLIEAHDIDKEYAINGKFFIKKPSTKKPKWAKHAEKLIGRNLDDVLNKSSSAVFILKVENNIFAFTFGYGRFLLNLKYFVSDFGIKTALNTLRHDSLRSVDLYTISDQPLQRKAQSVQESEMNIFGVDVSKDALRAVTGSAKKDIPFRNITGGDATYSFGTYELIENLPKTAKELVKYYNLDDYKKEFEWVDNIKRLKDIEKIKELDNRLILLVKDKDHKNIIITIPEVVPWDNIFGFSFTRSKHKIRPTLSSKIYLSTVPEKINIETLKNDRLFIYDVNENESNHSIYKCLYTEVKEEDNTYIFFAGEWYAIDNNFMTRINDVLSNIKNSDLVFPKVEFWEEIKDKKKKYKIESEDSYNKKASKENGYFLLDKKLVKSSKTTSPIELCDLLTSDGKFIHVKHRKGGSAGLSHLFAQGSVSAEILLGDRQFRSESRKLLRKFDKKLPDLVPLDGFKSSNLEVVYLILGEDSSNLVENLPFFSKVNLSKAYEGLTQRGFNISIAGAGKIARK